jgi:hypothetical protein
MSDTCFSHTSQFRAAPTSTHQRSYRDQSNGSCFLRSAARRNEVDFDYSARHGGRYRQFLSGCRVSVDAPSGYQDTSFDGFLYVRHQSNVPSLQKKNNLHSNAINSINESTFAKCLKPSSACFEDKSSTTVSLA